MFADYPSDALKASGTAAAPTSGSNFASLAAPRAGIYKITFEYTITGAAESNALNVRSKVNGATYLDFPSGGLNAVQVQIFNRVTLDGTNPVQLAAGGNNATASTVYTGTIICQQIA